MLLGALFVCGCEPARLPFKSMDDDTPGVDSAPSTVAVDSDESLETGEDTEVFRPPLSYDDDRDGYRDILAPDGNDCDDDNPEIHPDAWETLGDDVDYDCNGEANRARLRGVDLTWENPRTPVSQIGERWVVVGLLHDVEEGSGTQASALVYDRDALADGYREVLLSQVPIGAHAGLELALRGDLLYGVLGGRDIEGLMMLGHSWNPAQIEPPSTMISRHYGSGDYLVTDMATSLEQWVMVGCTPTSLHIMTGAIPDWDDPAQAEPRGRFTLTPSDADFTTCFAEVQASRGWATACGPSGCRTWALESGALRRVARWGERAFEFVDAPGRWLVGSEGIEERLTALYASDDSAEAQTLPQVFTDQAVRSASAAWVEGEDGGERVLAVVGTIPVLTGYDVLLALRRPSGEEIVLPLVEGVFDAEVSIAALEDALIVSMVITDAEGVHLRWSTYKLVTE